MTRLANDRRGTTLAMMGAFLIPVCALAGSAVDVARMYVVKVRLQQACDAGVLAGRKFMDPNNASSTLDATADARARTFFTNNFNSGWMQTNAVVFTPTKTTDSQVAGTASTNVPMTVMKMFGSPDQTLNVTCEARYDVADTDIIFVLDTTGSMACLPSENDTDCSNNNPAAVTYTRPSSNTGGVDGYASSIGYRVPERMSGSTNVSRIQALRTAVVDFYNTMATNIDPSTKVRYGFVTYSSMVNVGKAIMDKSSTYMIGGSGAGNWTYQSRQNTGDYVISTGAVTTNSKASSSSCPTTYSNRTPATWYTTSGTASRTVEKWNSSTSKCGTATETLGPVWQYQPTTYNVGPYVAGSAIQNPSVANNGTTRWWGCIEERQTTAGQTSFDINNLPPDLDPNLTPTTDATRWRPYWPDVEYERPTYNAYPSSNGDVDAHESYTDPDRMAAGKNGCAKPAQRLKVMSASEVSAFVNAPDFVPLGGTYHDIGMIWGVRFLSPNGVFASDTGAWPGRQAPKRVIVFLTDGAMAPSVDAYSVYGVENLDRRVRNGASTPTAADIHNARFLAECGKAKAMNIDVWTVAIAPAADANLTACASNSDQAFFTTSGSGLSTNFQKIAKQIAMLRISQ